MPELPEVETIRRDLAPLLCGRTITDLQVEASTRPLLLGPDVSESSFREALVGRTVVALDRAGKYLLLKLGDGMTWVVHLRMTGRLVWREATAPREPYERARVRLDDGHDLRWADLRKFGRWQLLRDPEELLRRLGPEPIDPNFSAAALRRLLGRSRAPVKSVLLDQRRLSGIGNIYADEALFLARVRPDTPAHLLAAPAASRLFRACREVLQEGIANRGASFRDYVDAHGSAGQQHLYVKVFRRTGLPCYICGSGIERTVIGGRATHFCPRCQKSGRKRRGRRT